MDPLRDLVDVVALYGVVGLMAVGLAERFVPAIPSHGVLVAIGISAHEGVWSIPVAVLSTMIGSLTGAMVVYLLARAIGEKRCASLLYLFGRLMGLSRGGVDRTLSSLNVREQMLIMVLQLIPAVRLISPLAAGLLQTRPLTFLIGTAAGIALWNGLFVCAGYIVSVATPSINASVLALKVLAVLVAAEALVALAWRIANRLSPQMVIGEAK